MIVLVVRTGFFSGKHRVEDHGDVESWFDFVASEGCGTEMI